MNSSKLNKLLETALQNPEVRAEYERLLTLEALSALDQELEIERIDTSEADITEDDRINNRKRLINKYKRTLHRLEKR